MTGVSYVPWLRFVTSCPDCPRADIMVSANPSRRRAICTASGCHHDEPLRARRDLLYCVTARTLPRRSNSRSLAALVMTIRKVTSDSTGETPSLKQCFTKTLRVPHVSRFSRRRFFDYSYRNASAGSTLAADHDGYNVATNDTPIATSATRIPSCTRMANGT